MQLWRKAMAAVWSSNIPLAKKLYLNVFFFGTRQGEYVKVRETT